MKGQITVFLSLIFSLVASIICALYSSAKDSVIRSQIEIITNAGLYSVFGEYNRELFERYDLLFIDASYGSDSSSLYELSDHVTEYMEYNLMPYIDLPFLNSIQLLPMDLDNLGISDVSLATDNLGQVYYEQVVSYMKDRIGIDVLESFINQFQTVSDKNLLDDSIANRRSQNDTDVSNIENEIRSQETSETKPQDRFDSKKKENPANRINAIRSSSVMKYIFENEERISKKQIDDSVLASNRELNTGTRTESARDGITDKILFDEYLLDKFPNYLNTDENRTLQYETEYILAGKNNDYENLNWVIDRLLLMREVSNFGFLLTDSTRNAEAEALATAIIGFTGIVPLIELTKISLLFAWAYAESVQDVKNLMLGGNIPLFKTTVDWCTDIDDLYNLQSSLASQKREYHNGMYYKDYLRILYLFESKEDKTMRSINLIERNIRNTEGNSYFKMDNCVEYIEIDAQFTEGEGNKYEIIRSFGYNEESRGGE